MSQGLPTMEKQLNRLLMLVEKGWPLNQILKQAIRFGLRTPARKVIIEALASLCALQTKPKEPFANADSQIPRILMLSSSRFGLDLDILAQTGDFHILLAPEWWQTGLISLFYPSGLNNRQMAHHQGDSNLRACQEEYRAFLEVFMAKLTRTKNIKCVVGVNYWYHQDSHWGAVSDSIGIPYIVFFKEGFRTQEPDRKTVNIRCEQMGGRFEGSVLATQNEVVRKIMLECGYVSEENSKTVGIPRMDSFVRVLADLPDRIIPSENPIVTLFSFNPGNGLLVKGVDPWPDDENEGWGPLFDEVHRGFAELACLHPNVTFFIKLKWGGKWVDRIEETISATGKSLSEHPNLKIVLNESAHELIEKSQVVCCYNSSTMLEAGVTKRAVVVPHFDSVIRKDLLEFVKFHGRDDLFDLARSKGQMIEMISSRLQPYELDGAVIDAREKEFEKWLSGLDGSATQKWSETIQSVL
jgi:hypothetical protein